MALRENDVDQQTMRCGVALPTSILLKVKGQDGTSLYFKISVKTPLRRLAQEYSIRKNLDLGSICLAVAGRTLSDNLAADELALVDLDVIEATWPESKLSRAEPRTKVWHAKCPAGEEAWDDGFRFFDPSRKKLKGRRMFS